MKKIISYKFRLNKLQDRLENKFIFEARLSREVWNMFVAYNIEQLSSGKEAVISDFYTKVYKTLKDTDPRYSHWKQGSSVAANMVIHRNKDKFNKFIVLKSGDPNKNKLRDLSKYSLSKPAFKRKRNNPDYEVKLTDYKGFPQFHSYKTHCSFSLDKSGFSSYDWDNGRIKLAKIGWVSFKKHRKIEGEPKNVTISRVNGKWYISIQCELEVEPVKHFSSSMIGVDRGVAKFAVCSDGTVYNSMNFLKNSLSKLAFLQRRLRKKTKNSNRYKKAQERIAKLHEHIANARMNYIHHVSKDITDKNCYIVMEDLKVSNMSRSAKGDTVEHGKNVKAKAGLNRAILDQGWGYLRQQIKYKSEWNGGYLELIDPKYTSQKCSVCGHVSSENRKTQESFVCEVCGHTENADINAAKNILADGQAVTARGGSCTSDPMKREHRVISVQGKAEKQVTCN